MTRALLASLLVLTPVQTAETVPAGRTMLHLDGGFALLRVDVPALPVVPLLTGDLVLAHGLADGIDLRGVYRTTLGLTHRLGPELRARLVRGDGWAVGARLLPSVKFVGSERDEFDWGGDVSTTAAALGTVRVDGTALTVEAGATVQWLFFERIEGNTHVDRVPYLAFVELGVGVEHPTSRDTNLAVSLEVSIPTAPDDPFSVLGVYPRLTVGGSFEP